MAIKATKYNNELNTIAPFIKQDFLKFGYSIQLGCIELDILDYRIEPGNKSLNKSR